MNALMKLTGWPRVIVGGVADALVMVASFAASFALRFEFEEPMWGWTGVWLSFLTVWSVQTAMLLFFDCGRRWRLLDRFLCCFVFLFVAHGIFRLRA